MPDELSNLEVVVLAVYVLGGDQALVDTEDAAMKASEIAPGRFTWRKYPGQISLEHVRVFLSDAKKPKNGSLLAGDGTKGWRLTPAGVSWATRNTGRAAVGSAERQRVDRGLKTRRETEQVRIRALPAWAKYSTGGDVSLREAEAVFRVSEYVQGSRREQLVDRGRALFTGDEDLGPFVEAMARIVKEKGEEAS